LHEKEEEEEEERGQEGAQSLPPVQDGKLSITFLSPALADKVHVVLDLYVDAYTQCHKKAISKTDLCLCSIPLTNDYSYSCTFTVNARGALQGGSEEKDG